MAGIKEGVSWVEMHLLAERVILSGLLDLGIVKGDIDEMIEKRVGFLFMPHGLGHLIGLDVHDVGGYLAKDPPRILKPGLKNLRTARTLKEGMVITVEPGCYFIDFLLHGEAPVEIDLSYVNVELALEYRKEVAGVRIEDNVVVRKDSFELLTKVPRGVKQIEACMRGEEWEHIKEEY